MRVSKLLATISMLSVLSTVSLPAKADPLGAILGAAGGAAIGSNIGKGKGNVAAIAIGTLVGASFGHSLTSGGRSYSTTTTYYNDDHHHYNNRRNNRWHDRYAYNNYTTYRPVYTSNYWVSPPPPPTPVIIQTSAPVAYTNPSYCREFTETINVGGQLQQGYGVACRQPDGSWQIQK